jgi:hypothetical protein
MTDHMGDRMDVPWRVGRKLGRTLYAVDPGNEDRNCDYFLGILDDPVIAVHICETHNADLARRRGANDQVKLMTELQEAINALPGAAGVVIEDEWGQKYDLVRAYTVGKNGDDPGLVLKVRMHPQHPDQERAR